MRNLFKAGAGDRPAEQSIFPHFTIKNRNL